MLKSLWSPISYVKDAAVGGLHMVFPSMGQGNNTSPPSSPSTTPVSSRRRTSSRKSRVKPRSRKSMKQPKPASADISTQETTTPGPNSSDTTDTDSHDDGLTAGSVAGGRGATGGTGVGGSHAGTSNHNGAMDDGRRSHSGTPNLHSATTDSSSQFSASEASGGVEYSSALEDALEPDIVLRHKTTAGDISTGFANHVKDRCAGGRVPQNGTSVTKFHSDENLHHDSTNETSDTDKNSLYNPGQSSSSSSILRKPRTPWAGKRLDSDFSTAPLSSETSDMDTSGHEKMVSDGGGSTSDLTSLSRDSRASDLSSDVFSYPFQQKSQPSSSNKSNSRPSSGDTNESKRRTSKTQTPVSADASPAKWTVGEGKTGTKGSPPIAKRPLKSSRSSPLKTEVNSVPKLVSSSTKHRTSASNLPPRPKPPPVANKPLVKPKPLVFPPATSQSNEVKLKAHQRQKLRSAGDPDSSVDIGNDEVSKAPLAGGISASEQRVPFIGSSKSPHQNVRKTSSESSAHTAERGAGVNSASLTSSPIFVPRKLSNVREESEDKESDSEKTSAAAAKPTRFSPSPRPQLLPTKLPLSSTTTKTNSNQPPPRPKLPQQLRTSSPVLREKRLDSTTSSLSSPTLVATKRKPAPPQKPALLPQKPGILLQTLSEGNLLSRGSTSTSDQNKDDNEIFPPPEKPPTKRRPYGRAVTVPAKMGQMSSPNVSPSPSASPTPPPPVPPRSPVLEQRLKSIAKSSTETCSNSQSTLNPKAVSSSSSSNQEDSSPPPPVPFRRGGRNDDNEVSLPGPSSPVEAASKPAPPVARRSKPSLSGAISPVGSGRKSPRRPPPCPPLSPSPPPTVPSYTKTIGHSTTAEACTADDISTQKRHSLFSPVLSASQINKVSQNYEVFDDTTSEETKQFEKLYQQSLKSCSRKSEGAVEKKTEVDQGHSATADRQSRSSRSTHYEMTFLDPEKPPVLLKFVLDSSVSGERALTSPQLSEDVPPPLPSQPIPKKKDRQQTLLKRGPIKARVSVSPPSLKSDDGAKSDTLSQTSDTSVKSLSKPDVLSDGGTQNSSNRKTRKHRPGTGFFKKMTRGGDPKSTDRDTGPDPSFRREAKSFSTFTFRRSNSDRFKKNKLPVVVNSNPSPSHSIGSSSGTLRRQTVHRTLSVDKLDDRMERSVRVSSPSEMDGDSSSDEDDVETIDSPTQPGLPQPPLPRYTEPPRPQKKEEDKAGGSYVVPVDEEPLYQYINTAEFLRTPQESVKPGLTKNQLDIARQLSNRRLWCEQPEIIKSGVLKELTEDEKKLQEAMFEVVTTEATYLRSLDVLIEHFMEDPGMNPNLPEGRRVLDKRQHHVIFSNVMEVREISAKFLEELRTRQKETAIVRGIADIILEYAEKKFDCYIRYCTNQIYQTRELQDCLENNVMFREYLKRLEKHKRCQHLSMQSFLLLPMQRITRLPLLILAIFNKTPLNHPDYSIVENSLRTVQKLVTECNDGARRMERTEQLHIIHQQLDFGKLKPFPLVSASRQLEKKGTVLRLKVEQKLFGRQQIKRKQLYVFVFTDLIIITKRKKDPKGEFVYKVVDYASRAVVELEDIGTHPGMSFPKHTFGEQDTVANATWAVSTAGENHAFLLILLDNVDRKSEKYLFVTQNDTDKTRWMESLATPESQREDEKIYQTWDCPQVQAIYDYQAAQPDELSLDRGDVVKVYRKMGDGWYEGEKLRDLQWGWFPSNFTTEIENEHTRARNLRETHRLLSLPYSPEEYAAKFNTFR